MVRLKYIQHIQNDIDKEKTRRLSNKIDYLNQAYIFHLVAYWQVFIESLVNRKLDDITSESQQHALDDVLKSHIENQLKRFNTPNTENIDQLFEATLGLKKITSCWNTDEFSKKEANDRLKRILNSRHQIAHTGSASKNLTYESNFEDMNFVYGLATLLQAAVDEHIF